MDSAEGKDGKKRTKETEMDEYQKCIKAHRYEKMVDAIRERVNDMAYDLLRCEDVTENEAFNDACEKILNEAENTFGTNDFYWVLEIIMNDEFGIEMSQKNPYKDTKPQKIKYTAEMSVMGVPVIKMEG